MSASDPDDLLDALTRLTADFRNYRARVERDRDRQRREDLAALLAGALEVLDVADAAAVGGQPADVAVAERLHAWLASLGLERVRAHRGTVFDPTVHEAVAYVLDPAGEPGELVVTAELRSGWTHDGILLRPAAVEVGPWT